MVLLHDDPSLLKVRKWLVKHIKTLFQITSKWLNTILTQIKFLKHEISRIFVTRTSSVFCRFECIVTKYSVSHWQEMGASVTRLKVVHKICSISYASYRNLLLLHSRSKFCHVIILGHSLGHSNDIAHWWRLKISIRKWPKAETYLITLSSCNWSKVKELNKLHICMFEWF